MLQDFNNYMSAWLFLIPSGFDPLSSGYLSFPSPNPVINMINICFYVQICRATEYSDSYDDGKPSSGETAFEFSTSSVPIEPEFNNEEKNFSSKSSETNQSKTTSKHERTLSGGLHSPKVEVPKNVILQRINSKKTTKSYQLGHQLSLKWSTGAGPRIGCVADYPVELRQQALVLVNLSPRTPLTPAPFGPFPPPRMPRTPKTPPPYKYPGGVAPTTTQPTSNDSNADGTPGILV